MKISDYVMEFIASLGVKKVFFISGGGAMHLDDSLGKNQNLDGICMLHEQGAAIAAEAYARVNDSYGCCLVTSGPGATNALTGLVGSYIDSIPVVFISGQVKRADLKDNTGLRQFGIQEVDIISMVKEHTKYAVRVDDPLLIRYELEKAASLAMEGRPGPVWIDIPLDIQASEVDAESLQSYTEHKEYPASENEVDTTIQMLNSAKRPVLMLGHGIRLGHAIDLAREFYQTLGIPVLTSWNGVDLIEEEHPLYFGRPGFVGHRAANFIIQNADFVLTLGTRLGITNTGYNYDDFLKNAKHVMVDIDPAETRKKSVHPSLSINADVKDFLEKMIAKMSSISLKEEEMNTWLDRCKKLKTDYPVFIEEQKARDGFVSNYDLIHEVTSQMKPDDIYQFPSSGTTVDIAMKSFEIKWGQRAFLTKGLASMGYEVPACVGSCIGSGGRRVVSVTGDGSFAMNMQELEVIHRYNLPVKIFVSDNQGYSMIYTSQHNNFHGRLTGCTVDSGLTLPDMKAVANAFGIKGLHIEKRSELKEVVSQALAYDGPVICTVKTDITQIIVPRQGNYMKEDGQMASRPLEDMVPLIDRDEFEEVMRNDDSE